MWRGGLSAPASLYLHADRPLISENATSALLHEVMHTALSLKSDAGMDWIVEGLAEYYSLRILHRSGTITDKRFSDAMQKQAQWGANVENLCASRSSGATTARAVTIMHALDNEIRRKSDKNLDDVFVEIAASGKRIDLKLLAATARKFVGTEAQSLEAAKLPGCAS